MASATGPSDARFETTAAWQATEASDVKLQNEVERNANQAHQVAEQAASAAQFKAPAASAAVEQLEEGLSEKTNEAVAEGKANTTGYVQQARELVGGAMATAASYLPSSVPGSTASATDPEGNPTPANNVVNTLSSAAGTAVETAKTVLTSAQQTVQPHVERLAGAAQPHVERLSNTVSSTVASATSSGQATGRPDSVPATTAPLESSGGVVGGPYPETTTGTKSSVAQV